MPHFSRVLCVRSGDLEPRNSRVRTHSCATVEERRFSAASAHKICLGLQPVGSRQPSDRNHTLAPRRLANARPVAKRRKIAAHGASRGVSDNKMRPAPKGRKMRLPETELRTISPNQTHKHQVEFPTHRPNPLSALPRFARKRLENGSCLPPPITILAPRQPCSPARTKKMPAQLPISFLANQTSKQFHNPARARSESHQCLSISTNHGSFPGHKTWFAPTPNHPDSPLSKIAHEKKPPSYPLPSTEY